MIIYMELSSIIHDLGVSAKALYALSNHTEKHYHRAKILKGNGEYRELAVPDNFLKSVQRKIADTLLVHEEISPYATAYRYGGSVIANAEPHLGNSSILKLDIRKFFDTITYPLIKDNAFPKNRYSEKIRILLTFLCVYNDVLPQGAPTSPVISNIIMREFDNTVGAWCRQRNICYTRYCDDMTFSGELNREEIIDFVKKELKKMGFFLNDKKTAFIHDGQKKIVTGIVINKKLNTSKKYRKQVRQEIFYCKKFGVASHMKHINSDKSKNDYLLSLLGKVNFILSVDKCNAEALGYKKWLSEEIKNN
ncbi:MAG: RNA-directed DNA polymerase [Clostridia bacterium]|nr:RNA-directed DNA polymerase [Clostridia bacterium]